MQSLEPELHVRFLPVILIAVGLISFTDVCAEKAWEFPNGPTQRSMKLMDRMVSFENGYDQRVRPFADILPARIACALFVNSLSSISDVSMDYSIDVYMRQQWLDPRLAWNDSHGINEIVLQDTHIKQIWVPDLFFRNAKRGDFHHITTPNKAAWLSQDGTIFYSQRLTLIASCPMNLEEFPFDHHICKLILESYAFALKDLEFMWKVDKNKPSVELNKTALNRELPEFMLENITTGDCSANYTTGAFACLYTEFHFQRDTGFYISGTYIPSFLIVILSWVSFYIDPGATPARISLGILTVLTIATQGSGLRSQLPRVSYVKAIDWWMSVCLAFVFGALIECAMVNFLHRKEIATRKARDKHERLFRTMSMLKRCGTQTSHLGDDQETNNAEDEENTNTLSEIQPVHVLNSSTRRAQYAQSKEKSLPLPNNFRSCNSTRPLEQETVLLRVLGNESTVNGAPAGEVLNRITSYYSNKSETDSSTSCTFNEEEADPQVKPKREKKTLGEKIDIACRVIFPGVFVVFNVLYWTKYTLPPVHRSSSEML